ncbi:MAG: glycosyltransferase [Candidatus Hodarchaeales archaeon]|jgi:cellulose synthase/poly-beta-1,6-N-acetylglucosamine synthase-like glycosyltransferase
MQIISIVRMLVSFTVLFPSIILVAYSLLLIYYSKKEKYQKDNKLDKFQEISILIPTHNEETIIEKRIENIFDSKYPFEKMNVIFIDDSSDSTADIIQKYVDKHSNFHLIRFNQRMGYSVAIQAGIEASDTDIIILNEAGSFPRPDSLIELTANFENPEIGAVTAKSVLYNTDEKIGEIESVYLRIINFIRKSESNMDSTIYIKGEATGYRRELVSDIVAVPNTGSIDTSMAFWVRKKGYKTVFDPKVVFDEYAPTDDSGYIKQKTIRAANIMRNLMIFKNMILNPKYGKFGVFTLTFHTLALFIFPFFPILFLLSFTTGILIDTTFFLRLLSPIIGALLIILLFSKNLILLIIELEISLVKSIYQIFVSRVGHDKIERVESTRRIA